MVAIMTGKSQVPVKGPQGDCIFLDHPWKGMCAWSTLYSDTHEGVCPGLQGGWRAER